MWETRWQIIEKLDFFGLTGRVAKVRNKETAEIGLLKYPYRGSGSTIAARGAQIKKEAEIMRLLGGKIGKKSGQYDIYIPRCLETSSEVNYENQYYIAEFAEGISLEQYIKNDNLTKYDFLIAINALLQVIEYVHEKNYLWLDVKTEHVIINKKNRKIYCIDWGNSEKYVPELGFSNGQFNRNADYKQLIDLIKKNLIFVNPPLFNDLQFPSLLEENFEYSIEKERLKSNISQLIRDDERIIVRLLEEKDKAIKNLDFDKLEKINSQLALYGENDNINYEIVERRILDAYEDAIKNNKNLRFDLNQFLNKSDNKIINPNKLIVWNEFYFIYSNLDINKYELISLLKNKNYIDFYYKIFSYISDNKESLLKDLEPLYNAILNVIGKDDNFSKDKTKEDIIDNLLQMRYGAAKDLSKELLIQENELSFSKEFYDRLQDFVENLKKFFDKNDKKNFDKEINFFKINIKEYSKENFSKKKFNNPWFDEIDEIFEDAFNKKMPSKEKIAKYKLEWIYPYVIENYNKNDIKQIRKQFEKYKDGSILFSEFSEFVKNKYWPIIDVINEFNSIYELILKFKNEQEHNYVSDKIKRLEENELYRKMLERGILYNNDIVQLDSFRDIRYRILFSKHKNKEIFNDNFLNTIDSFDDGIKWKYLQEFLDKYQDNKKKFHSWNQTIENREEKIQNERIELVRRKNKFFKNPNRDNLNDFENQIDIYNKSIDDFNTMEFLNGVDDLYKNVFEKPSSFKPLKLDFSDIYKKLSLAGKIDETIEKLTQSLDENDLIVLNENNKNYNSIDGQLKEYKSSQIRWKDYSQDIKEIERKVDNKKELSEKNKIYNENYDELIKEKKRNGKVSKVKLKDTIEIGKYIIEFGKYIIDKNSLDKINSKNKELIKIEKQDNRRKKKFIFSGIALPLLFLIFVLILVQNIFSNNDVICSYKDYALKDDNTIDVSYQCSGFKGHQSPRLFIDGNLSQDPFVVNESKDVYTINIACESNLNYQLRWQEGWRGNREGMVNLDPFVFSCIPKPIVNLQPTQHEDGVLFTWDQYSLQDYSAIPESLSSEFNILVVRSLENGETDTKKPIGIFDTEYKDTSIEFGQTYHYDFIVSDFRDVESAAVHADFSYEQSNFDKCVELEKSLSASSINWVEGFKLLDTFSDDELEMITSACNIFDTESEVISRAEIIKRFFRSIRDFNPDDLSSENQIVFDWLNKNWTLCELRTIPYLPKKIDLILDAILTKQNGLLDEIGLYSTQLLEVQIEDLVNEVICSNFDAEGDFGSDELPNDHYDFENLIDFSALKESDSIFSYPIDGSDAWRTNDKSNGETIFRWPMIKTFAEVDYLSIFFKISFASGENETVQMTNYGVYLGDQEVLKIRYTYSDIEQKVEFLDIYSGDVLYATNYDSSKKIMCLYYDENVYCAYGRFNDKSAEVDYFDVYKNFPNNVGEFGISLENDSSLTWDFTEIELYGEGKFNQEIK